MNSEGELSRAELQELLKSLDERALEQAVEELTAQLDYLVQRQQEMDRSIGEMRGQLERIKERLGLVKDAGELLVGVRLGVKDADGLAWAVEWLRQRKGGEDV